MAHVTRLVLIGESNPYGSDPAFALYHLPRHASGNRLREHLGLRDATYEKLARANLCSGPWRAGDAREKMRCLLETFDVLVCLGAKAVGVACGVLGWERPPFFGASAVGRTTVVSLPHPSGLNRAWNVEGARDRARAVLRGCAPDVPWGEVD